MASLGDTRSNSKFVLRDATLYRRHWLKNRKKEASISSYFLLLSAGRCSTPFTTSPQEGTLANPAQEMCSLRKRVKEYQHKNKPWKADARRRHFVFLPTTLVQRDNHARRREEVPLCAQGTGLRDGHVAGGDTSPSPLDNGGLLRADCSRVRIDTAPVTNSDITQASAREQSTLDRLEPTPATARKTALFADASGASAGSDANGTASYAIIDLSVANVLLDAVQCKTCRRCVRLITSDQSYGLAVKLIVLCDNCGEIAAEWNSRRVDGEKKCNPFELNILASRAMLSTGNAQTAMNDIFSVMRLSQRGMHNKTFQWHLKNTLQPAATRAAVAAMAQATQAVAKVYDDLCFGHRGNIAVVGYTGIPSSSPAPAATVTYTGALATRNVERRHPRDSAHFRPSTDVTSRQRAAFCGEGSTPKLDGNDLLRGRQ
ncbi:uncharacterized protein LOC144127628 [Amblyomma americanum]